MKKAWLVTTITILAGVVIAMVLFKVPPTMVVIMKDMNAGLSTTGLLMSMVAVSSILLALPSGAIMQKIGPKKLGLVTFALTLIGNILGALAPNMTVLLVSRLIEGMGFGMIGLVVPAIIAAWFPAEKRGLPMAIWTLWVSIGMLIIFNMTNVIVPGFGWRGVWWFVSAMLAIFGILFALYVNMPEGGKLTEGPAAQAGPAASVFAGFGAPGAWLLAIIFVVYSFGSGAFSGFYPTFLVQTMGMDMATANSYSSIATAGMMIGGILTGFILNRIPNKSHTLFMVFCTIITCVFFYIQFEITSTAYIAPLMLIIGIVYQTIPAVVFTIAPEAASSVETIAATMGIIALGTNFGGILSTIVTGVVIEQAGGVWTAATPILTIAGVVGIFAAVALHFVIRKKYESVTSQGIHM